jgi:hypothetical protein
MFPPPQRDNRADTGKLIEAWIDQQKDKLKSARRADGTSTHIYKA